MVGESNYNVILIQIDASMFTEFDTSEFEISQVDCTLKIEADEKFRRQLIWRAKG